MERCQQLGIAGVEFHRIGIPDEYVHHGSQDVLRAQYDLDAKGIAKRVKAFVGEKRPFRSLGEIAEEITRDLPDSYFEKLPKSDQVDEVVYGVRSATK